MPPVTDNQGSAMPSTHPVSARSLVTLFSLAVLAACAGPRAEESREVAPRPAEDLVGAAFALVQVNGEPLPHSFTDMSCPGGKDGQVQMVAGTLTLEEEGRYSMRSTLRARCLDESGQPKREWLTDEGVDRGSWRVEGGVVMVKPERGREAVARLSDGVLRLAADDMTLVFEEIR